MSDMSKFPESIKVSIFILILRTILILVANHFAQIVQKRQFNDLNDKWRASQATAKDLLMLFFKRVLEF